MQIIVGVIIAVVIGIVSGILAEKLTNKIQNKNKKMTCVQKNSISEKFVQECIYSPNRGRSIDSTCNALKEKGIVPRFILQCKLTMEK